MRRDEQTQTITDLLRVAAEVVRRADEAIAAVAGLPVEVRQRALSDLVEQLQIQRKSFARSAARTMAETTDPEERHTIDQALTNVQYAFARLSGAGV